MRAFARPVLYTNSVQGERRELTDSQIYGLLQKIISFTWSGYMPHLLVLYFSRDREYLLASQSLFLSETETGKSSRVPLTARQSPMPLEDTEDCPLSPVSFSTGKTQSPLQLAFPSILGRQGREGTLLVLLCWGEMWTVLTP